MQNLNASSSFVPHLTIIFGIFMRKIISLICILLPIVAFADSLDIRENAPDRHVVVKGDTLWDISATFFKDPWKWQQIWGLNKNTIKDPHWIYPGDVVFLDRTTGTLRIGNSDASSPPVADQADTATGSKLVKLSPRVRELPSDRNSIPVIPFDAIAPFLSKPLVIDDSSSADKPILVSAYDQHQLLGTNDLAYVKNLPADRGTQWQIYRLGRQFVDPDSKEALGHEAIYLGDATVEKFAPISELRITKVVSEVGIGDYFTQSTQAFATSFEPHAPKVPVSAKIISIYGGVGQAGQNSIITLNKGTRDGLENGHVLALYQKGAVVNDETVFKPSRIALPNTRYGLIFVFRTFQKVAYALVLQARIPVQVLDSAQTP